MLSVYLNRPKSQYYSWLRKNTCVWVVKARLVVKYWKQVNKGCVHEQVEFAGRLK